MSLASLVVELSANTAKFQSDMGKAVHMAERGAYAIKAAFASLGIGIGVMALANFAKETVKAVAALDDMAERTGAAVEKLSQFAAVASVGGHSTETVEMGLIRLAKALGGVDEKSSAAKEALASIGLNALDIRKLDPADALKVIAERLDTYKDGMGKTALAQALFGRSGGQLLPFLKDLAEQTEKLRVVTAEEAAEAERLEKDFKRMQLASAEFKKGLLLDLLPALTEITGAMVLARKEGEGLWSSMFEGAKAAIAAVMRWNNAGDINKLNKQIVEMTDSLLAMESGRTNAVGAGYSDKQKADLRARIDDLIKQRDALENVQAAVKGLEPPKFVKPEVPFAEPKATADGKDKALQEYLRVFKLREADAEEQKKLSAEIAKYKLDLFNTEQEELTKMLNKGQEDYYKYIETIEEEAVRKGQEYLKLQKAATDEMTEFWKQAAHNMQSAMSDFFFDVMQGNLSDLAGNFKRTIDRMVANVLAAKAATALFGPEFGKGGEIGGLVKQGIGWLGGLFGGGNNMAGYQTGLEGFATGTDYVPRTGLAVVHQGEAIIPAAENVGGRSVVINMNINTPDANSFRASRGQIAADMSVALAGARRHM